jgi:hypothetical protein
MFRKKSALDEIATEIAGIKRRRDRLATKVESARSELAAATAARLKLHVESETDDAKAESSAQRRVETSHSALEGLEAALAELETQLRAAEAHHGAERDRIARQESADEIERQAQAAEDALAALSGLKKLAEAFGNVGDVNFDCAAIGRYAEAAANEIELASAFALRDVRSLATAIANGDRPIPHRQKDQITVLVETPKPPPLQSYFVLQPGMFTDDRGTMRRAPRYEFVSLNPQQAAHAIRMTGVCEAGDRRVKELCKKQFTQQPPEPHHCQDWDNGSPPRGDAELFLHSKFVQSSPFQPLDRGAPYTMAVRARPAVASRVEDEHE